MEGARAQASVGVASKKSATARSLLAQASVELISIMGVSLVVILVFSVLASGYLSDIGAGRNQADARDAVQKLAAAADSVYAQGEGASSVVLVKIPANADLTANSSYIGKPANAPGGAESRQINIRVAGTDVFAVAEETVTGSFPQAGGTYYMRLVSRGNYVAISTHYVEASKRSVYQSMASGETRSESITFTAVGNESVTVTIGSGWGYNGSVAMSIEGGNPIVLAAGGSAARVVTFVAGASASGLYNSELTVSSVAANGVTETFTVPITADVHAA